MESLRNINLTLIDLFLSSEYTLISKMHTLKKRKEKR